MGYYEEKQRMNNYIEEEIKKKNGKITKDMLVYLCTKSFAIGEKTVLERVKFLEKIAKIEEIDGVLAWIY